VLILTLVNVNFVTLKLDTVYHSDGVGCIQVAQLTCILVVVGILIGTLTMELGGVVTIKCEKTGYWAELEFKLKVSATLSDFLQVVVEQLNFECFLFQQHSFAKITRWLYCVECPQYSTQRRSASNIHRSSMLRKNR